MNTISIRSNFVDIINHEIYPAEIIINNKIIESVVRIDDDQPNNFILPGFIDSHVHIESSMLIPSEFARLAVVHGTVATVSDPHEIANVCGVEGVRYMIENGKSVAFKFYFGAPSCVPATQFETAGATLGVEEVNELLQSPDIKYLAEMMNFPGVLHKDDEVMKKIAAARQLGKPVDGHAPGLRGEEAKQYIEAGIYTDHECFTAPEALDKLRYGMKILIREGSAAKNFDALIDLMHEHYENMMFCSDDKHPDSLAAGHIDRLCARAIAKGIDIFKVLQAACINPVQHYKLNVGLLQPGDPADFIVVKDLKSFEVLQTYIDGNLVAENGKTKIISEQAEVINNFHCTQKQLKDFEVPASNAKLIPVIEAIEGQLITNKLMEAPAIYNNCFVSDPERDILKIVVVNRYEDKPVAKAFIKNFGLVQGAIASSVAHDSHNIIAIGVDDASICEAVNLVIKEKGGVSAVSGSNTKVIPLPVAGLMSMADGYTIANEYTAITNMVKDMGSKLAAPFMTLSFMALLVIPALKLSDKGLFDGVKFEFINNDSV